MMSNVVSTTQCLKRLWFADPAGVFFVDMLVFGPEDEAALVGHLINEPGYLGMTNYGEAPGSFVRFLEENARVKITEAGVEALAEARQSDRSRWWSRLPWLLLVFIGSYLLALAVSR